jgi:hypothetical protein
MLDWDSSEDGEGQGAEDASAVFGWFHGIGCLRMDDGSAIAVLRCVEEGAAAIGRMEGIAGAGQLCLKRRGTFISCGTG